MAGKLFISYRRDDEAGTAGRLYDHLVRVANVPRGDIFKDVDNIVPGVNFVRKLNDEVAQCELMIAVVGRRWTEARDDEGRLRLHDEHDFVRIEVEAALRRGIPLIPILVDGARPPRAAQLPASLHLLCEQQALEVSNSTFDTDIRRLVKAIEWHRAHRKRDLSYPATTEPRSSRPPSKTTRKDLPRSEHAPVAAEPLPLSNRDKQSLGGLYYFAEAGDSQYLYEVATRIETGHGVQKNSELALQYYKRAAKAGYAKAHVRMERLTAKIARGES